MRSRATFQWFFQAWTWQKGQRNDLCPSRPVSIVEPCPRRAFPLGRLGQLTLLTDMERWWPRLLHWASGQAQRNGAKHIWRVAFTWTSQPQIWCVHCTTLPPTLLAWQLGNREWTHSPLLLRHSYFFPFIILNFGFLHLVYISSQKSFDALVSKILSVREAISFPPICVSHSGIHTQSPWASAHSASHYYNYNVVKPVMLKPCVCVCNAFYSKVW